MKLSVLLAFFMLFVTLLSCQTQENPDQELIAQESPDLELIAQNDPEQTPTNATNQKETLRLTTESESDFYYYSLEKKTIDCMVKINAAEAKQNIKRTPLNIALVIDRSGSMAGDKLAYVKQACKMVIDNLTNEDYLSIVMYDTDVTIVESSAPLVNKKKLKDKIDNITDGGSTFLSGGLLEGFSQVKSTYDKEKVNRVLLLSDGLANQGITDINELQNIVKNKYRELGIAVSTFGVGADFNEDLMTNLAEYGNGNYYYMDSPEKIPGIFEKELRGLLSIVAKDAVLKIDYPQEYLTLEKSYGYDFSTNSRDTYIDFKDIFSKEEKLVILRFKINEKINKNLKINFKLSFDDARNDNKASVINKSVLIKYTTDLAKYDAQINKEVIRHRITFYYNEKFSEIAKEVDFGKYEEAKAKLDKLIKNMKEELKTYNIAMDESLKNLITDQEAYMAQMSQMRYNTHDQNSMIQKSYKSRNYMQKKNKIK